MRYIRFLKAPKFEGRVLKTVVTITSDLGDDCIYAACQLLPVLTLNLKHQRSLQITLPARTWSPGDRAVSISHEVDTKPEGICSWNGSLTFVLTIRAVYDEPDTHSLFDCLNDRLGDGMLPQIMSVASSPFSQSLTATPMSQRTFETADESLFSVWETNGETLEGHIWDAGFASIVFFNYLLATQILSKASPSNLQVDTSGITQHISVLELGCGTGIVGLFLASKVSNCSVTLTDLSSATELVQINIRSLPQLAPGSSARFSVLEWGEPLPACVTSEEQWDLVIASDINYNPDNAIPLVSSIDMLSKHSPEALILIASKKRHESEDVFWTLMADHMYMTQRRFTIALPTDQLKTGPRRSMWAEGDATADEDLSMTLIHFTLFTKRESSHATGRRNGHRLARALRNHELAGLWMCEGQTEA